MSKYFWLFSRAVRGQGRKRYLAEVLGLAPTRTSRTTGRRIDKVLTRVYVSRRHRWSGVRAKPVDLFTIPAAPDDPLVLEASEKKG